MERLVARAVGEFGRLDVLVSNAGISKIGPIADVDVDGWSAMIDVNLRGVLHGIAAAMPVFREQGSGHFVTTVSTAGLKIVPDMAVYAAPRTPCAPCWKGCVRSRPTASSAPRRSRRASCAPSSTARSTTRTLRAQIRPRMDAFGLAPEAVARAIAFAIEQPHDVEIGDLTIRPTVQG